MFAKVLIVSDLHKRQADFTTIVGYVNAVTKVQLDILKYIKENNITHFISLGDWYDKGYTKAARTLADRNLDVAISEAVNGNAYICTGNHLYLERDNNPEFYLVQPNERYIPREKFTAFKPIFKAVDTLQIEGLQISLFHYNKLDKTYTATRNPETTYHVGIYHDDCVIPSALRQRCGLLNTQSAELSRIYDNIDLAVIGHIHTPLGVQNLNIGKRTVPLMVPGSLCITANSLYQRHDSVQLPILEIDDDKSIHLSTATFSTHIDELQFSEKKETVRPINDAIVAKTIEQLPQTSQFHSLQGFLLTKNYPAPYVQMVQSMIQGTCDIQSALNIITKERRGF